MFSAFNRSGLLPSLCAQDRDTHGYSFLRLLMENQLNFYVISLKNTIWSLYLPSSKGRSIKKLFIIQLLSLITMEIFLENNKKDIFLEWEISINQAITWRDKLGIQSSKQNSVKLLSTFATDVIILFIGWLLG